MRGSEVATELMGSVLTEAGEGPKTGHQMAGADTGHRTDLGLLLIGISCLQAAGNHYAADARRWGPFRTGNAGAALARPIVADTARNRTMRPSVPEMRMAAQLKGSQRDRHCDLLSLFPTLEAG